MAAWGSADEQSLAEKSVNKSITSSNAISSSSEETETLEVKDGPLTKIGQFKNDKDGWGVCLS